PPAPPVTSGGPVLVVDTTVAAAESAGENGRAAVAARLGRPSTTVPQGTLIPAVLETALDSTRPGHVRAIVSRDVRGFDGSQVLIPRGTRVFGDYQADMSAGQNRALVQWTRLVRPDGVTIAIASPAADMEGRAGIEGRVDSHSLERFGGALLRTILNVGGNLVGQRIGGDGSVIILPGGSPGAEALTAETGPRPTLRVAAGARVTVFVARDLEFPPSEAGR
ncbi:MAG: TrbI/VirB10 family protein, partial [Brevundimonas sp.]